MFVAGLCLYGLCAVAGVAYGALTHYRPSLSITAYRQADRHLQRGEVGRAVQQLRMAARIDRSDYESPRQVASVLQATGDSSGQIDHYERGRDLAPGDAIAHRMLGWAYYNNGRFDEADTAFVRSTRLDPRNADAYLGRVNVSLDRDRPAEAVAFAKTALEFEPANAKGWNLLGIALDLQGRRSEAALAFEQAVRLDSNPTFAKNLRHTNRPLVFRQPATP
jgi:Flp pilus assembly protein TadD